MMCYTKERIRAGAILTSPLCGRKTWPLPPRPSVPPERSGGGQFLSKKVRAKCIITAPKLTLSELTAPRGEYAALRRAKSAFVFAVKSQSSPQ